MDYKQKYLKYKKKYLQIKKLDSLIGGSSASSSTETFNLEKEAFNASQMEPLKSLNPNNIDTTKNLIDLVNLYTDNKPSLDSFEICKQSLINANRNVEASTNFIKQKILLIKQKILLDNFRKHFSKEDKDDILPNRSLDDILRTEYLNLRQPKQISKYLYKVRLRMTGHKSFSVTLYSTLDNVNYIKLSKHNYIILF